MTRNRTLNIHTLSPLVLFSAVLTVLIASAAPAHEAGADHPSAKSSAAATLTQASTPVQAQLIPLLPKQLALSALVQPDRRARKPAPLHQTPEIPYFCRL